jgi:addiction module HigA family antidote
VKQADIHVALLAALFRDNGSTGQHPGPLLSVTLRELGLSQRQAAGRLGVSDSYISDVISGKRGVSVELALKLERICGPDSAMCWLLLQLRHDLAEARNK